MLALLFLRLFSVWLEICFLWCLMFFSLLSPRFIPESPFVHADMQKAGYLHHFPCMEKIIRRQSIESFWKSDEANFLVLSYPCVLVLADSYSAFSSSNVSSFLVLLFSFSSFFSSYTLLISFHLFSDSRDGFCGLSEWLCSTNRTSIASMWRCRYTQKKKEEDEEKEERKKKKTKRKKNDVSLRRNFNNSCVYESVVCGFEKRNHLYR